MAKKEHPERGCHLCGRDNISWYVNNDLWNKIIGSSGLICCPICFVKMAEKKGVKPAAWRLSREGDAPEVNELRIQKAELKDEIETKDWRTKQLWAAYYKTQSDLFNLSCGCSHIMERNFEQVLKAKIADGDQ